MIIVEALLPFIVLIAVIVTIFVFVERVLIWAFSGMWDYLEEKFKNG